MDGDGMTANREYWSRTDPLDPASFLGLTSLLQAEDGGSLVPIIRWASSTGVQYRVEVGTNLVDGFTGILFDNVPATPPENVVTDRTDSAATLRAYRVRVK